MKLGDYRIRWANIRCSNGHRWTTERMCIAERRYRWFGWWPLRDGDWRDREKDAEADIEHDRALRTPLPPPAPAPPVQVAFIQRAEEESWTRPGS